MKFLVVLSVALVCVAADISEYLRNEAAAPILKQAYDISPQGQFRYTYKTANGIAAEAEGYLENVNNEYPDIAIKGAYRYTAPDGSLHERNYVADAEGNKIQGNDIPTPPPVPEAILRGLAYIASHPPQPTRA